MGIEERLKRCCGKDHGFGHVCQEGFRCNDCFDKLEGWREIEHLNGRIETLQEVIRDTHDYSMKQFREIERLREALRKIADTDPEEGTDWFHAVANAALQQKDSE